MHNFPQKIDCIYLLQLPAATSVDKLPVFFGKLTAFIENLLQQKVQYFVFISLHRTA